MSSPDSTQTPMPASTGPQSLARSLQILSELVACDEPVSATELALKVGLHQSSVSRILSTLQAVGFVRKPDYHHFAADYGLLTFAANAIHQFPLIQRTLPVLRNLAPDCGPLMMTVATLWRKQVLYLVRYHPHAEPAIMAMSRYPMHLSSPGLRMLIDLPNSVALETLEHSRRELGWERPGIALPDSSAELLEKARALVQMDVLTLDGWQRPDIVSAAIPVRVPENLAPATLAISGPNTALPPDRIRALLQQGARAIETALNRSTAAAI